MKWLERAPHVKSERKCPRWFTKEALRQGLRGPGCLICGALHASEKDALDSFLREGMMVPQARQVFLEGGGFCDRHFRLAKEIADDAQGGVALGLAILCEQLMALAESAIATVKSNPEPRKRPASGQKDRQRWGQKCVFCRRHSELEEWYVEALEEFLDDPGFSQKLESQGLCHSHLQLALPTWRERACRIWLAERTLHYAVALRSDVSKFIEEQTSSARRSTSRFERTPVLRSLEFLVSGRTPSPGRHGVLPKP